jgi:AcrR family transcriptional regulator
VAAVTVETATALNADRLKKAAFELACERGLAALSARTLAAHTGGSPSAINYHFGNREQLLFALYRETTACLADARDASLACGLETVPDWVELPHVFTAVLQAQFARAPGARILLLELEQEIVAGREPQLRQMAVDEFVREQQFWFDLARHFGANDAASHVWADLAPGLLDLLLCETDPAVRSAWISAPAVRLHQRVARQTVALVSRRKAALAPDPETSVIGTPPANDTARAILDAALAAIAKNGADRLTQREVATSAGVSLASVTYFFRTKHVLINATFEELCRRMRANVNTVQIVFLKP